jgi:hypothetical protein
MVYSLVASLPPLASVASFLFCVVFLMGVFMVQMYAGNLRRRCVDSEGNIATGFDLEDGPTCDHTPGDGLFDGLTCPINTTCSLIIKRIQDVTTDINGNENGNDVINSSVYYTDGYNPHYGSIGFDYLLQAMLMIIVSLSCEGWTEIMYRVCIIIHHFHSYLFIIGLCRIHRFAIRVPCSPIRYLSS